MTSPTLDAPYDELRSLLRKIGVMGSVGSLLGWDEQVNLPTGSAGLRAEQQAAVAETLHAAWVNPRIGELLARLEAADGVLPSDRRAVVRESRKSYDRATRLPAEFVREMAEQHSRGFHVWAAAKAASDFASYIPVLEKNIELAKRETAYLGRVEAPYDVMIDDHDPGMTAAVISKLFAELKAGLVPFVRAVTASKVRAKPEAFKGMPVAAQTVFLKEVTARIGFDYDHGRIDTALHPFCSGIGQDVRMTTRFVEHHPIESLFSSIHETGHGLYTQGQLAGELGNALGMHAGMAVHESQSRLWENQVARSREFWRHFEPRFREVFPVQSAAISSDELYLAVNAVRLGPIRVESDEVTYNLHILLRFDIEQRLFAGTLAVADIPAAWKTLSGELLGLTPANDREGVLQDVHWSGGSFGYFPSYCLGNMIAAQLWHKVLELRPNLEEDFARGDFAWLLNWLRENIHSQGRRYDVLEFVRRVTGSELSPKHLLGYLRERYGPLYLE